MHCTCTNACAAVHASLHDTGTNSVPTNVLLYHTYWYCCKYLLLCTYSASGGRGEAWRGVERQKSPYRPRSSSVHYTLPCLWHCGSALFLLYSCCIVHTLWVHGLLDVFCCCVLCCTTAVLRTAVVLLLYCCCTGWLGGSVRGCVHGFVSFFCISPPPLCLPRAGIVRRITSTY